MDRFHYTSPGLYSGPNLCLPSKDLFFNLSISMSLIIRALRMRQHRSRAAQRIMEADGKLWLEEDGNGSRAEKYLLRVLPYRYERPCRCHTPAGIHISQVNPRLRSHPLQKLAGVLGYSADVSVVEKNCHTTPDRSSERISHRRAC